ncbi:MAG: helicase HerA-like domain-containing protein [Myxococcota bacterium]
MPFYLGHTTPTGQPGSSSAGAASDSARVDYPPKHLTTHGLIFGMTGSGKTGLALVLLEEAQRAGIPIIAIDPKGDLANLALAWPELGAGQFATWLDPGKLDGATSPLDLGQKAAEQWKNGLAAEGLGEGDIRAMRQKAAVAVYTPGSTAGIPVSLLSELAPPADWATLAEEDRSELVGGLVAALLALVDVPADPLQSKEAILVSTIVLDAWGRGETLDLGKLVKRVETPPIAKLGVYDVDEFMPPKKRKELALQLNALVAAPAFQAWRQGEPLDVEAMLKRDPRGSRTSIFSIAHLDDSQRLSFVALLLDRVIGWMRAQSGTGDLRALLYMDEVFGYLPPHPANPPSKRPLLTLMKQARAFGLGVVLATQNPVDVDYKALTNAGTWLIGKLQTDNDKDRVLDGLMAASTAGGPKLSRGEISDRVSALEPRQFLMQDAAADGPVTFKSRFAMSYLRGPMTRQEIAKLVDANFYNLPEVAGLVPKKAAPAPAAPSAPPRATPAASAAPAGAEVVGEVVEIGTPISSAPRPMPWPSTPEAPRPGAWPIDEATPRVPGIDSRYLPSSALTKPDARALFQVGAPVPDAAGTRVMYRPALYAEAHASFRVPEIAGSGGGQPLDGGVVRRVVYPLPSGPGGATWRAAEGALDGVAFGLDPVPGAGFVAVPAWLWSPADRERAKDLFVRDLVRTQRVRVPVCLPLGTWGQPGESLEDFKARLAPRLGAATERAVGKLGGEGEQLRSSFQKKVDDMKEQLAMDQRELAIWRERGDAEQLKKAELRVRSRIERYKELVATRDKFVGLAAREVADVEFAALDKLEACEYRDLVLEPRSVQLIQTTILWIPSA